MMTLFERKIFFVVLCRLIDSTQINLDLTNELNDGFLEHHCLRVATQLENIYDPHQTISYCLTEWPLQWRIEENSVDSKWTFAELMQLNITSERLLLWSIPIDIVERYQIYVDHSSTLNESSLSDYTLHNCTSSRFGPLCEYSLDLITSGDFSLHEIIYAYYQNDYQPINLTCYIHLQCNRGSTTTCLHWTEICDGYIDCLHDGIDEEHCWQLDINQCTDDEYRCINGQCISQIFYHDGPQKFECIDRSDETYYQRTPVEHFRNQPTIDVEDIVCSYRYDGIAVRQTSSCLAVRDTLLKEKLTLDHPEHVSSRCWIAFRCDAGILYPWEPSCQQLCSRENCREIVKSSCPDFLTFPMGAMLFGHVYLGFTQERIALTMSLRSPQYVCYDDNQCGGFHSNRTVIRLNKTICRHLEDFSIKFVPGGRFSWIDVITRALFTQIHQCNTIIYANRSICHNAQMYQCVNSSKCISIHRVRDNIVDCDYRDDEECALINGNCSHHRSDHLFKCTTTPKCISLKRVGNNVCDCGQNEYPLCDDEISDVDYVRKHVSFPTICDGFTELKPIKINGHNETDETECDHWQCDNIYTHCDGVWNCFDGADESNCDSNCPPKQHRCVSPVTYQLMCLPLAKANDGHIDCLGGTDEPHLCRLDNYHYQRDRFYCKNNTNNICLPPTDLCNNKMQCTGGEDEYFCRVPHNRSSAQFLCTFSLTSTLTDVEKFFCQHLVNEKKSQMIFFSLDGDRNASASSSQSIISYDQYASIPSKVNSYNPRCYRGLPLQVWSNKHRNISELIGCLCPPSFYGNQCQYENQRVSLTLKLQAYSHSRRILFTLVISLMDHSNERTVHSYEQVTYLYIEQCQTKFNFYLLYSRRPKDKNQRYFLHIDIYEKVLFRYRGSFYHPIPFAFLPVNRLAIQLTIPHAGDTIEFCRDDRLCVHGRCIRYLDSTEERTFCQCDRGWSGEFCHLSHQCQCSPDSLCLGVTKNNRSICICPLNRWGPRCFLSSQICEQNGTCHNGGQCIFNDDAVISNGSYFCLCPAGFSGQRCELADQKLLIHFDKHISLASSSSILIHFIRIIKNSFPENGSTFTRIPINRRSITISWPRPYHLAFAELFKNQFYLITVEKIYNRSKIINRTIQTSDHCPHFREIINETIADAHLIRRIKFYHFACQQLLGKNRQCFYDQTFLCLCQDHHHRLNQRMANCFEFNSSIRHDCFGASNCENSAQCLQDRAHCPQTSVCFCSGCFYGTRCQFSSSLFGLSLDGILGDHIQPNVKITRQSRFLQISMILSIVIIVVGLINGILSMITFWNDGPRKLGSGSYLIGSSVTTLFTMIIFGLKFWILVTAQMTNMNNRVFLYLQCVSLDFLLKVGLNMDQWLNACVAMERSIATIKGVSFNRAKSKQMAKYIIASLLVINIITNIQDPVHRRLFDDYNDNHENGHFRIWCIVSYPSYMWTINSAVNIFHFTVPFFVNIVSAIIIIALTTRNRMILQTTQNHQRLIRQQFRQHKHLLITPVILISFAVPRIILSLISGCMKSNHEPWLFLIGYFISFMPVILTFIIFVLPSSWYKREFHQSIRHHRQVFIEMMHSSLV